MRLSFALFAATAGLTMTGTAQAKGPAAVEVKDAVARVTVIPEARSDIKVEIAAGNPKLPLWISTVLGRTIIDGKLGRKLNGCHGQGESTVVHVRGPGDIRWTDMPRVVIRTPRDVNIDTGGAVWGMIGRSSSVKLGSAGCGDWTVGNVDGALIISQAGTGNTRAGSAGSAKIRLAMSGDVATADIRGPVQIDIAGSGNASVASVSGPLMVHTAGSGNVRIAAGHATNASVATAGSGNVGFGGAADSLKAHIAGSGDIHAREVTGRVSRSVIGSGRVTIGE